MTAEQLEALRHHPDAPYNHREFTIWLHNKILEKINFELWNLRENKGMDVKSGYAMCNHVMSMESLKTISNH